MMKMSKVSIISIRRRFLSILPLLLGWNCIDIQAFVTPVPSPRLLSLSAQNRLTNNCARKVNLFAVDNENNGKEEQETTDFQLIQQNVENILNVGINGSNEDTAKNLMEKLGEAINEIECAPEREQLARLQLYRKLVELRSVLKDRLMQFEAQKEKTELQSSPRVAGVDYDIKNINLKYKDDFIRFRERVFDLFQWKNGTYKEYMAPYFPLVQSSGTGKTKLMYELMKQIDFDPKSDICCKLILCNRGWNSKQKNDLDGDVFPEHLDVSAKPSDDARDALWKKLNKYIQDKENVILLFDESQSLIADDGWYFRSIRWWLRLKRPEKNVVAVFAGTTTGIANYYQESPQSSKTSRDTSFTYLGEEDGKMYPPFYEITTMGLIYRTDPPDEANQGTEYDVSVPYGRPLFARMHLKGDLEKSLQSIMLRMIGNGPDDQGHFSILGTRIQLGQVAFDFASKLVSSGYAHLTYFTPERRTLADIAFLPDPVCARLAMSLMIEGCNLFENDDVSPKGESPSTWAERAIEFFTTGLCRPAKGNIGEIAVAFYLLVCGDKLRYEKSQDLKTFSVSFDDWVQELTSFDGNQENSTESMVSGNPSREQSNATISFIQVCRNHLRHFLNETQDAGLLENWYKSGRAIYTYDYCPAYDIIVPIRYGNHEDGGYKYCPMVISVKNRIEFSKDQRGAAMKAMKKKFDEAGLDTGVCMLVLIGLEKEKERNLGEPPVPLFQEGNVTCIEIIVPEEDQYGATKLARCASCAGGERSEVMASHAEVALGADFDFQRLLRSTTVKKSPSNVLLESVTDAYKTDELKEPNENE